MVPSWQLEVVERLLNQLTMVQLGAVHLLELQTISMESPSAIIPSWQLDKVEGSLNQLTMVHLGIIQLLELQTFSMESPSVIKT